MTKKLNGEVVHVLGHTTNIKEMKWGSGSGSWTHNKYKGNEMGGCGSGSRTHDKYKRNEMWMWFMF